MATQKKFTFKTEKPTGKWKSFHPTFHYVKLNKVEIGTILDEEPHTVRLRVIKKDINEDGNPNCTWKWITLKGEHQSIQSAKDWINEKFNSLTTAYKFPTD